jgi:hypothetical protein
MKSLLDVDYAIPSFVHYSGMQIPVFHAERGGLNQMPSHKTYSIILLLCTKRGKVLGTAIFEGSIMCN